MVDMPSNQTIMILRTIPKNLKKKMEFQGRIKTVPITAILRLVV